MELLFDNGPKSSLGLSDSTNGIRVKFDFVERLPVGHRGTCMK